MESLIRLGQRSDEVADIQARMRALGIAVEDDPGWFGESTRRAVRTFQQRRGLIADGIVGPDTWAQLVEAGWRLGDRVLYLKAPHMRGDDVMALQTRLIALGFATEREDGILGRNTDDAIRAFQREYGLAEDGLVGPRTLQALWGLRVDRPATAAGLREELKRTETSLHGTLVVVDPGHGGDDRGHRGERGLHEADVCWDLATRVARDLAGAGARARFTRTEARGPDDGERARLANELDADLFVSLHLNFNEETPAEGSSAFYFPSSRAGAMLADRIQSELAELGLRDCRSHPAGYRLLRETRMPAVLVEPCFISNPDEEKRLEDPEHRTALAGAIVRGIASFYEAEG